MEVGYVMSDTRYFNVTGGNVWVHHCICYLISVNAAIHTRGESLDLETLGDLAMLGRVDSGQLAHNLRDNYHHHLRFQGQFRYIF